MATDGRIASALGGILSYFTRHATAANLVLVVMIALGLAAIPRMRAQFFPDVIVETVSVGVKWEGAGPEEVDGAIVQLLEPALLAVEGVEESNSSSFEGRANISLDFEPGWDMSRATEDVQAAVDAITDLPEDAEAPVVRRGAWRDRVTDVIITGPVGVAQLGLFADEFVTRLFREGVTRATIRGIASPETVIEVSEISLVGNDVSVAQIAEAVAREADTNPAGDVADGSARVRTGVAKRTADEIRDIVLRTQADGSALRIGDVARVFTEGIDRDRAYFVGGASAISIRIDRSDLGDAIGIQETVQRIADTMELTLPEGTRIELVRTRAEAITARINILVDNGLMGLGLVLVLLFLFLNFRTAFWVAAGIPAAMIATIALMQASGLTINMISLFALIITLGIVVDDAIVVGEHADFRARHLGEDPVTAAENAARRMAAPVLSATLTTIIAFFALTFISGRFGQLIADIPFTVVVVLAASLVECFIILPNHMSHALRNVGRPRWYDLPNRGFNVVFRAVRERLFRPFVRLIITARYAVIAGVVLILATQVSMFLRGDVIWRFFNAPELGSVSGNFAMVPGATRDDTLAMMRELQRATEAAAAKLEAEHGENPITFAMGEVGGNTGRAISGADTKDPDLLGSIAIELIDADLRPYTSFEFIAALEDEVRNHPLLETLSFRGFRGGPGGDALDVQLIGADSETLKAAAEALKTAVARFAEVSAVEDNLAFDKEELVLELTPQGETLGFNIDGIGRILRNRLNGVVAATYPDGPRSAEIRVRLPKAELDAAFLDRTLMRSPGGEYLPLSDLVLVTSKSGFAAVRRENGLRLVSVTGDIAEDDPARAEEVTTEIREVIIPKIEQDFGVATRMAGLAEQENRFLGDALTGFTLCLAGIYLTLAWVFASWTRPIVVMAIIPFGLVGTIWGHYVWEVPLSMFTVVGLIGMTGIIINDSIVLISTVDEYAAVRGRIPAIVDACVDRLRPVMLTTATTVFGLAPLLFETSQQAQFLRPTVITLCYGLGFGMVLVLLVVPSLLVIQHDIHRLVAAFRKALFAHRRAPELAGVVWVLAVVLVGVLGATVGYTGVTGTLLPQLADLLPDGLTDRPLAVAFAVFAACVLAAGLVGVIIAVTIAMLVARARARRASA